MPFAVDNEIVAGILLAILVMTLVFLIGKSNRYLAGQRSRQSDGREAIAAPREQPYSPAESPEASRWEPPVHEQARELSGQLDGRMITLNALIAEADRVAARLEAAIRQTASAPTRPASQADALRAEFLAESQGEAPEQPGQRAAVDRPKEEIYALADYGFSTADIAQRVGLPIGEVQLILSLRGSE